MTKFLNKIFIFTFFFIVSYPTLSMLFEATSDKSSFENRSLALFPDLTKTKLKLLPDQLNIFYNDHFGLRNLMLKAKTKIEGDFFSRAQNLYMLRGKNGYYFLNPIRPKDENPNLNYSTVFFTPDELRIIKGQLEKEEAWFKERNISYMVVIVPDKEAVYPEYYPFPNHLLTNYKLDQLIVYLQENSTFRLVDLRNTLIDAKKEGVALYYKGDSHWNDYGSFFAYQEIMKRMKSVNPKVYVPQFDDFDTLTKDKKIITDDLARIDKLAEGGYVGTASDARLVPKPQVLSRKKLGKVYIYGDSFSKNIIDGEFLGLASFLRYSFKDVYTQAFVTDLQLQKKEISPLEYDLIEQERPELVIREMIQRNMRILLGPEHKII